MPASCSVCLSSECPTSMAICERCKAATHLFCLEPMLFVAPACWKCESCTREECTAGSARDDCGRSRPTSQAIAPRHTVHRSFPLIGRGPLGAFADAKISRHPSAEASPPRGKVHHRRRRGKVSGRARSRASFDAVDDDDPCKAIKRRRRTPVVTAPVPSEPNTGESDDFDPLLELAIRNSIASEKRVKLSDISPVPTLQPTEKEFADPIAYISGLHALGVRYGILKIVPPASWKPAFGIREREFKFATREQHVHELQRARGFDSGSVYDMASYRAMASRFRKRVAPPSSIARIEEMFWDIVNKQTRKLTVEYGNDIDSTTHGSGFAAASAESGRHASKGAGPWDLNWIAHKPGSPLRCLGAEIRGVTAPWVYCGMLFSSFCWHCEDHHLPSINYLHKGSPKVWYGAASGDASRLEEIMRQNMPELFEREPDLMQKLVTMLDPRLLVANGVPVHRAVQTQGTFVVTFPRGYHAGINTGFNVAEAVNFAYDEWFSYGRRCTAQYASIGRPTIFSHEKLLRDWVARRGANSLLQKEIRKTAKNQATRRKRLARAGLTRAVAAPEYKSFRDIPQCVVCGSHCMSFVTCTCSAGAGAACLDHAFDACACDPKMCKTVHLAPRIARLIE